MLGRSLALVGALFLSACVERKPATVAFSVEEAAFIKKDGTGVITGHAFRTKPSGVVVNAAGQVVRLIPATGFARERFSNFYGKGKFVPHRDYPREDEVDPAYSDYSRTTKAESNGRFIFENVAPGSYFITTQVIWGDEAAFSREGGSVYDSVTLTGKETRPVDVILSGH
ncbi:carboxypeptidase regulatory-like domain-containing protein [Bosea sp. BH3]|uniref:carboxypeptidase regulatory-like domain-containing protein n=1 Tax=Bosea sp. BH3 TaxID=2871701 RepID=UPI0021CAF8E6|nr:carboxypeptidase regulatory-like domain-containing protein [Bosea sp. BH3]MCU4178769.1 carboxypeptidase regulatory-like domain-containing protein [Bosea sp. BH3]